MPDHVQLIAYADRLGGTLPALGRLLDGPLAGLFGGVHVLPFYRPFDGADAGFDPVDHLEVDPRLGTWSDIAALAQGRGIVADLIVNHVSDRSVPFRDVVSRGDASPSAGMFLSYDRVFPGGATEAELLRIVRPRPGLPFTPIVLGDRPRLLWTTFTPHQIDLDVRDPAARVYLSRVLLRLAECGVTPRYTRAEVDEAARQPPVARLLELVQGCGARTGPSRAGSACPALRRASWCWRGGTEMPPPSCGSGSRPGRSAGGGG